MVTMQTFPSREEWLKARTSYIGGSDVGAILGLNPWMSNVDLWEIKTGRKKQKDISNEPTVKYGTNAEQYLRELFKLDYPQYEVFYKEHNMWHNDKYDYGHASLDGWLVEKETDRKGIWECKTSLVNSYSQLKEKWGTRQDPKIPDTYFCQVVFYLLITEFDFVHLTAQIKFGFSDEKCADEKVTREYHIERSEVEDDIAYIAKKCEEFAQTIREDKRPALLLPEI